jgi:hypothetical protein
MANTNPRVLCAQPPQALVGPDLEDPCSSSAGALAEPSQRPVRAPARTQERVTPGAALRTSSAVRHGALTPSAVTQTYERTLMGEQFDTGQLVGAIVAAVNECRTGDLASMEAMLVSQAMALQAIFTSLAVRAEQHNDHRLREGTLALALKAQAQGRATIQALADLKNPPRATFVQQANIAAGAQQVNNTLAAPPSLAMTAKTN